MSSQRIPRHIEGQLGYYSLVGEASISEGAAEAARFAYLVYYGGRVCCRRDWHQYC